VDGKLSGDWKSYDGDRRLAVPELDSGALYVDEVELYPITEQVLIEGSYIWHFPKEKTMFKRQVMKIDEDLNVIRNKGRNLFLEGEPSNFSSVIHDYSDERKGFVLWRDLLEERLY
jgi:hypothetical protein